MRPLSKENTHNRNNHKRHKASAYDTNTSPLKPALDLAVSKIAIGLNASRANQTSYQNIST